jgi:hypothetical protein
VPGMVYIYCWYNNTQMAGKFIGTGNLRPHHTKPVNKNGEADTACSLQHMLGRDRSVVLLVLPP